MRKLFGATEEEQYRYLKPRLIALGIGIVLAIVGELLYYGMNIGFGNILLTIGGGISIICLFLFGWCLMRAIFGYASVGAVLSGNVVIGVVIFIVFVMVGYLGGMVIAMIGLCRFLVLLKRRKDRS